MGPPTIPLIETTDLQEVEDDGLFFEENVKPMMPTMGDVHDEDLMLMCGIVFVDSEVLAYATVRKYLDNNGYMTLFDANAPNQKERSRLYST